MSRERTFSVTVTNLPCSCGGTLHPFRGKGELDISVELGIPSYIAGEWMGLRCDECGEVSLPGSMLDQVSNEAVLVLLRLERRLSGVEARFLRKAALAITQEELATRLGLSRPTVARWEADRSLSGEHDFQLRSFVALNLLKKSRHKPGAWASRRRELIELVADHLDAARSEEAPLELPPLRLERRAA